MIESSGFNDAVPGPGKVAFYVITGFATDVEYTLGVDAEGNERTNDNPCP